MRRILFNLLSALSLSLCLGTAFLWARSYDVTDRLSRHDGRTETGLISAAGEIGYFRREPADPEHPHGLEHTVGPPRGLPLEPPPPFGRAFLRHFDQPRLDPITGGGRQHGFLVAHWLLLALAALLPLAWPLAWNRRRIQRARAARGLCPKCGYDIRSTPDRCPECGFIPTGRTPRSTGTPV